MKIKKIKLENYRGHKNFVHEFNEKIGILCGDNGAGKTSIVDAIQGVITGDFTAKDIHANESFGKVEITFLDDLGKEKTVSREIKYSQTNGKPTTTARVNGKRTKVGDMNKCLEDIIHSSIPDFKISSASDVLFHLKPSEFNDFILKYIPNEITLEKILSVDDSLGKEVKDKISQYFKDLDTEHISVPMIKDIYEKMRSDHRFLKRETERLHALVVSYKTPETLMKEDILQEKIDQIMQDEAAWNAFCKQKKIVEQMQKEKLELESFLAQSKFQRCQYTSDQYLNYIDQLKEYLNSCINQMNLNNNTIKNLNAYVINISSNKCLLHQNIICRTDKSSILESMQHDIQALTYQNQSLEKNAYAIRQKIQAYEECYKKVLANEKEEVAIRSAKERISKIDTYLANVTIAETKQYDFSKEKTLYMEEMKKVEAYKEFKKNEKLLNEKKNENSVYKKATDYLSMKGPAMEYITSYYLDLFNNSLSERTSNLDVNLNIRFVMDKGITYSITKKDEGTLLSYDQLSTGEKKIVAFLILDLLNLLTGNQILFLDDLDQLDKHNFKEMLKMIKNPEFLKNYNHVFLSFVGHQDLLGVLNELDNIDYLL